MEVLFLIACAAFISVQLFIPPFIGIADNGDFLKITGRLSLAPEHQIPNFTYVVPNYERAHKYRWKPEFLSSELLAAGTASELEKIVGPPHEFDIRYLGAVHSCVFLTAFYLLLILLRRGVSWVRFGLVLLALWIFTDVFYVSYYNTFYSDTMAVLALLLMIVLALHIAATSEPKWQVCCAFLVAALLYVTSKAQHALMGVVPAAFIVWALWGCKTKYRVAGAAFGVVLIAASLVELRTTPEWMKGMSLFDVVFNKITRQSPEPAQDLRSLALPDSYSRYVGQHAYLDYSPAQNMTWSRDFYRQVGYARVLQFYLRRPDRTLGMMHKDLRNRAFQMRPIGNFCIGDGHPPGSKTDHFASWSNFRSWLLRVWPEHVFFWYVTFTAGAIVVLVTSVSPFRRKAAVVALGVSLLGVCEFGVATLADAAETNRHLFLFHVLTDISIYFALAAILGGCDALADRFTGQ